MSNEAVFIIYICWNIITLSIMGIDKKKAEKDKWRIKESTLLTSAFCMGGIGILTGSLIFHHKTRKMKFRIMMPLAAIANIICICFVIIYF